MVSERSLAVLHAIVSDYVASNEPVGSQSIATKHGFGVSAATIRNDMATLEELGLIAQPHTSSGRVPTDKGYRMYVDTLAKIRPLSAAQRTAIERFLGEADNLDEMMARTVRLLSQLTQQVAVVQYPSLRRTLVQELDLRPVGAERVLALLILGNGVVEHQLIELPEPCEADEWVADLRTRLAQAAVGLDTQQAAARLDALRESVGEWAAPTAVAATVRVLDVVCGQLHANRSQRIAVAGSAHLSRPGEFSQSLPQVLEALEEQVTLLKLFSELVDDGRAIASSIGHENDAYGLGEVSVIASSYEGSGNAVSRLGVLGPTRMDYVGNMAAVRAVARYLHRLLGESGESF